MTILIIEGSGYEIILYIVLAIMLGPPLLLWLVGRSYRHSNKKTAKTLYIIAALYLIIGLGVCGTL